VVFLLNDVSNLQTWFSHRPLLQKPPAFVGEGTGGFQEKTLVFNSVFVTSFIGEWAAASIVEEQSLG
jgi:hypothetical protein